MAERHAIGRVLARRSTSLAPRVLVVGGGFAGVTTALELAKRCAGALPEDPWTRRKLLTFVVVGAGHAGTELMAALEELTRGILLRHYPSLAADMVRLVLVGSAILPQTATNLAAYTKEQLLRRGIEIETSRATRVSPEGLSLADGRLIPSQCVIWTAGNRVNEVVCDLALPKARDGRLTVNEFFEVGSAPGVYALGDNASQRDPHSKELYPATAQVA